MPVTPYFLDDDRVGRLQALYKTNPAAAKMLDNFADRRRDRKVIEVDSIGEILPDIGRSEIIEVFKKLDDLGLGHFLVGRRGAASRFEWEASLRSVGRTASGDGIVEAVSAESDEEDKDPQMIRHAYRLRPDFTVQIDLPGDFTSREATRIADFIRTLPFAD